MLFPIVLHKDPDSDYGVTVPDLPGCFSAGRTIEEAVAGAREAIELHIESLLDRGKAVAVAPIETHQRNAEYAGGIWALVNVDMATLGGKAVRVNITVQERVLRRIDAAAKAAGEGRSEFLVHSASDRLTAMDIANSFAQPQQKPGGVRRPSRRAAAKRA